MKRSYEDWRHEMKMKPFVITTGLLLAATLAATDARSADIELHDEVLAGIAAKCGEELPYKKELRAERDSPAGRGSLNKLGLQWLRYCKEANTSSVKAALTAIEMVGEVMKGVTTVRDE